MKKLLSLTLLAFGLAMSRAEASVAARGPKDNVNIGYSTAISSITPFTVLESTTTSPFVIQKPGAVYQVILGTGVAQDFCVMYDTSTAVGLTPPSLNGANYTAQLGPRMMYSSTTNNSVITFDPPLVFYNGLMVGCSALQSGGSITYEMGRGLSGQ